LYFCEGKVLYFSGGQDLDSCWAKGMA
jgi:hypothetical protein